MKIRFWPTVLWIDILTLLVLAGPVHAPRWVMFILALVSGLAYGAVIRRRDDE